MKKPDADRLPAAEIDAREHRVLTHFLTAAPEEHKPLGKNSQARRRARERREAKKAG
ncbi:MAG: hypothetical protein ACREHE_16045 [Rhizomicrobium sp.]